MKLEPGATIGIIGGGQLGRMLALSAAKLGFKTAILDPAANAPAFQCANTSIVAKYDDEAGLAQLAKLSDVVTYEFENVPDSALDYLGGKVSIHPGKKALSISQDRLVEKNFLNDLGITTAPFAEVSDTKPTGQALADMAGRGIVKTRRFGYDGKGQIRVSTDDANTIAQADELAKNTPCILEGFVEFEREVSLIAARATNGSIEAYDPAENVHKDGILSTSTVPANISPGLAGQMHSIASEMLSALNYVGVIGIEFFVTNDGELLVNEFAPRVHNSGHWTEAACTISQFEQHIRAIAGLPLGNTARHSNCVMENLIGDEVSKVPEILPQANAYLHLYGKEETRKGRKMGHFTTITPLCD